MVLAAVQWGMIGVAGRVAMAESVPPVEVAFWRATLGALGFAAHATITRAAPLLPRDRPWAAALGIGGVAVMYLAHLSAVRIGGVAVASILLYSAPLWVAVGGWLGWGERPGRREMLPLALTLLGVSAVALSSRTPTTDLPVRFGAVAWGLLSGVSYALYYLMGRRLFAHNAPSRVLAWVLTVGALALAPFCSFTAISMRAWAALGFLAAFCTFGAYLAYAHGVQRLAPARAATVATLEPVVAVGAAYLVWGERLAPAGILGAGMVLAGILWSARLASGPHSDEIRP
jgi:DME family drug/metabolite transporter